MQNYNPQLSQKLVRFGDPIPFGESVSFVCEKGMAFEEDYHQTSFEVTCQVKPHYQSYLWDWEQFFTCWISLTRMDQKAEALEGIFWSQRRMSGRNVSEVKKFYKLWKFVRGDSLKKLLLPGPLCSPPPEVPFEGSVEVIPGIFQEEPISSCQVWWQHTNPHHLT